MLAAGPANSSNIVASVAGRVGEERSEELGRFLLARRGYGIRERGFKRQHRVTAQASEANGEAAVGFPP